MSNPVEPAYVFVIIPAYNEDATIRAVAEGLLAYNYTVVIVDDGSTNDPSQLLTGLPVYFLRHRVNLGQGAALQTGIEFALSRQAEYLVTFDADGQHQPGDIPVLLQSLQESGADLVTGSRFMEGSFHNMPAGRKMLIQAARFLNFIFTGLYLSDAHNGLRAMNRMAAEKINLQENGMAHATELLSIIRKQRIRHTEVPVHIQYTDYSRAKGQTAWSSFRVFFDLLLNKFFK